MHLQSWIWFTTAPFTVESGRGTGALGAEHLRKPLTGIIGLVLVLLYLIWRYRGL